MSFAPSARHRSEWLLNSRRDMGDSKPPPLTCCLITGDYQNRITWIEDLARRALRCHTHHDLVLRLFYAPESAEEVKRMVEQERMCCAFLTFDVNQQTDALSVTITAPETAQEAADTLFRPFVGGSSARDPGSQVLAISC
jgi:hypothetical protein